MKVRANKEQSTSGKRKVEICKIQMPKGKCLAAYKREVEPDPMQDLPPKALH